MMNINFLSFILLIPAILFSGCAANSVLSRTYDFGKIKSIGVVKFNYNQDSAVSGAEDIFAKGLIKNGFKVVERARIKQVLDELKISGTGLTEAENTRKLGNVLGVNALLMGDVSYYPPEKKKTPKIVTVETYTEPIFSEVDERQPDGSYKRVLRQTGQKTRTQKTKIPGSYSTLPKVGIIGKLVDVETAEIVWVGSVTKSGANALDAAESGVDALVKELTKDYKKALNIK